MKALVLGLGKSGLAACSFLLSRGWQVAGVEKQRRLALEADARHTGRDDWRMRLTLEGLTDIDAGRLIDDSALKAWTDGLGTDNELPVPQPN